MGLDMYLCKKNDDEEQMEVICHWRKANEIHRWFCDHVAHRELDDCEEVEVTLDDLRRLMVTCVKVLDKSELVEGEATGSRYNLITNRYEQYTYTQMYIKDPRVAEQLLPTQDGFFFGSTTYDEWYIEDLLDTVNALSKVLLDNLHEQEKPTFHYYGWW